MRTIKPKLKNDMANDPYYKVCARYHALHDHICSPDPLNGKLIEWEHALIYAGKQINEKWAIIPICYEVHRGRLLNKEINVWIALNRATDDELRQYSKAENYIHTRDRLNEKYGILRHSY